MNISLREEIGTKFFSFYLTQADEFHHAAAESYQKLLNYFEPKVLLGLTATPERMDGKNILEYFENTIASEMRLTEAIDRKLLSPFQYFCVTDNVDLSKLKWNRKGYDIKELENVYTSNKLRSRQVVDSVYKYVTDIEDVKGLGFCVSIEHAKYMSDFFNENGIASIALYAGVDSKIREEAKNRLANGEITFIFVVDLYNEGVDIPEINTVLFLRPTESLTVFVQQLGRGLRLSDGKECLTVLDFVGQAHRNYNFEEKFRALIGRSKHSIKHYLENGFFNLPKGCFIQLERQAKEYILRNIKETSNTKNNLISKMRYFEQDTGLQLNLNNFLRYYNMSIYDFYGKNRDRSFKKMMVEADLIPDFEFYNEKTVIKRLPNLFYLNSASLINFITDYIKGEEIKTEADKLMLSMLYYTFFNSYPENEGYRSMEDALLSIFSITEMREEILDILEYKYNTIDTLEIDNKFNFICPLKVHCNYSTSQILASLGYYNEEKTPAFRKGVKYFEDKKLDIFFITLNKSEKDFSPSTLYEDYAINDKLFHWQTQSKVSKDSKTAQRYINHRKIGSKIALFVREHKKESGYTSPFVFLGACQYIRHSGDKPMSFIWELDEEMPPMFVPKANKNIL